MGVLLSVFSQTLLYYHDNVDQETRKGVVAGPKGQDGHRPYASRWGSEKRRTENESGR
ncbi:DUF1918 domain-containing protein [Bremerella cremea]|nr:DUF1918 domain-containing protein [Bremerella cremea]